MTRVRLTKKLALMLNGVDVSALKVGDIIELPDAAAYMLVAEQWAEPVSEPAVSGVFLQQQSQQRSDIAN